MQARRSWVALAAGCIGLAIPASPSTAAVSIGQLAPGSPPPASCINSPFDMVPATVSSRNTYSVPMAGTVTSWSTNAAAGAGQMLTMKVFRKIGEPATYLVVGHDGPRPLTPGSVNTFSASIPVQPGDLLGLNNVNAATVNNACLFDALGDAVDEREGDLPDGASANFDVQEPNFRPNVTATIEPDCDNDGLGDETQDSNHPCPRLLTLDASKNKVKKGKRVRLSGQIAETRQTGACAANQAVELQRSKPGKGAFKAIEQLQTDAAGAFSSKRKVKKTFEYRAQLAETATCGSATSNTEKVKAKQSK